MRARSWTRRSSSIWGSGQVCSSRFYQTLLAKALTDRGLFVERHKSVAFTYDGVFFEEGLRLDLLVERKVVVELKSVEKLAPIHSKQLLTYLRLLELRLGLLLNFGAAYMKDGIRRVVNDLHPLAPWRPSRLGVNESAPES